MLKSDRLALIKLLAHERGLYNVSQLIPVSKVELKQETDIIKEKNKEESLVDEEIDGFKSQLKFEDVKLKAEAEDDILLTVKEKIQLKMDMAVNKSNII